MNGEELGEKKEEIEELGLTAIKEYFHLDRNDLEAIPKHVLDHIHKKAKIGMQFEREMTVSKRAIENNYIRIFRLVAEDKKELRKLIKNSLPHYSTS